MALCGHLGGLIKQTGIVAQTGSLRIVCLTGFFDWERMLPVAFFGYDSHSHGRMPPWGCRDGKGDNRLGRYWDSGSIIVILIRNNKITKYLKK